MAQRKLARIKLPGGCDEALRREGVTLAKVRCLHVLRDCGMRVRRWGVGGV
jgi:hypothetical protein